MPPEALGRAEPRLGTELSAAAAGGYSTSPARRPKPVSVGFDGQIDQDAACPNERRAAYDLFDFRRGYAAIYDRVAANHALRVGDDLLVLTGIVRQRHDKVMGESKAQRVGLAKLEPCRPPCIELVDESLDVARTPDILTRRFGSKVVARLVKLALTLSKRPIHPAFSSVAIALLRGRQNMGGGLLPPLVDPPGEAERREKVRRQPKKKKQAGDWMDLFDSADAAVRDSLKG